MVTGNYFDVLGLKPFAGRLLQSSDDKPGAPMGVVMSYQAWQRDYNADPSIVGSTFILNTYPVTILGITPPAFYGDRMTDSPPDFYIPMVLEPQFGPAHPTTLLHNRGVELAVHPGQGEAGDRHWPVAGEDERGAAELSGDD